MRAKALFYSDRKMFELLMEKLTAAVTRLLQMQIAAGVDAVQIFDSLGGLLSEGAFAEASGRWIRQIVAELNGAVPVIVFAKGRAWKLGHAGQHRRERAGAGLQCAAGRPAGAPAGKPRGAGQSGSIPVADRTGGSGRRDKRILGEMRGKNGHIFNLGHGVPPDARLESIAALVETVQNFK